MKKALQPITVATLFALLAGCAVVDVTKTAKGFHNPTNPNEVEILKTVPARPFIELGTVTVQGFRITDSAKMHNSIRTKSAALGSDAVILTEEGILPGPSKWATGVAIKFQPATP
jgi:hypothetical protein